MSKGMVLLVDDSVTIRTQLSILLRGYGYESMQLENGSKVVETLKSNDIDLMFLDINMPIMNGLDTLRDLKKHEDEIEKPPIFVLSTENTQPYVDEARSLGANGWVVKPIETKILEQILDRFAPSKAS
ncbi:MAG: hypothetical protein CMP10_19570 [Zetaproteobacteria bacterium]|nr:hypothetical protein [Pseudobdellovibrionaceae bacterium]|tara:strand:+ start:343 stop:726 length:384 start_codon:yes stop_codon:yes gene_type:complete